MNTQTQDDPLIAFAGIVWSSPQPGLRFKEAMRGGRRIRQIEMDESFVEADWCRTGHVGFVIEGTLAIDFDGHVVEFKAGDALCIAPGEASRHKARAVGEKVLLFVVD